MAAEHKKLQQVNIASFGVQSRKSGALQATSLEQYIGLRVEKQFIDEVTNQLRPFRGIVVELGQRRPTPWFLIRYEDGDSEHVTLLQLQRILIPATATQPDTALPGDGPRLGIKANLPLSTCPAAQGSLHQHTQKRLRAVAAGDSTGRRRCPGGKRPCGLKGAVGEQASLPANIGVSPAGTAHLLDSVSSSPASSVARDNAGPETDASYPADRSRVDGQHAGVGREAGGGTGKALPTASSEGEPAEGVSRGGCHPAVRRAAGHEVAELLGGPGTKAQGGSRGCQAVQLAIRERQRVEYSPDAEPWRGLKGFRVQVNLEPALSLCARKAVSKCKETYYRRFRKAQVEEDERVSERKEGQLKGQADRKRPSKRPDRVTESWMKSEGLAISQQKRVGFVPGIAVNDGFYSRAELSVCGMHAPPVAGIDYVGPGKAGPGCPSFAVSVVQAGCYEDDHDNGEEIVYTGEGGNDLLGNKKQHKGQKLERGNLALVGNIALGLPVRVIRKNKDSTAPYGCVLVFDGLYDVVEYWSDRGNSGHLIYRYRLIRRAGQGQLLSQKVTWGAISAPKEVTALNRPGVVDTDISGGLEALPIWAVNQTDDGELPPCSSLGRIPPPSQLKHAHLGLTEERLEELQGSWSPGVEYVNQYMLAAGVQQPPPPSLPSKYRGRPHDYLKLLNGGVLPYHQNGPGHPPTLIDTQPVVYECGPWCNCPLGASCPQAATQHGLRFRLEVFRKRDGTGWGVRSLDMIPQWSFVCMYYGQVFAAGAYEEMARQGYDGSYSTDMLPRPAQDDEDGHGGEERQRGGRRGGAQPRREPKQQQQQRAEESQQAAFVVCGLRKRNVGAFLNHSCDPNIFVQPVLREHHDRRMPGIAMFASKNIMPMSELTWDYGQGYVEQQLQNKCKCGSEDCISLRGR